MKLCEIKKKDNPIIRADGFYDMVVVMKDEFDFLIKSLECTNKELKKMKKRNNDLAAHIINIGQKILDESPGK